MARISMSGLNLSFMKDNPLPKGMERLKDRIDHTKNRSEFPAPMYMADIKPFVSPVGETPTVISSRKHLRDHERGYGMYQVGNDFPVGTIGAKNQAAWQAREDLAASYGITETGWGEL